MSQQLDIADVRSGVNVVTGVFQYTRTELQQVQARVTYQVEGEASRDLGVRTQRFVLLGLPSSRRITITAETTDNCKRSGRTTTSTGMQFVSQQFNCKKFNIEVTPVITHRRYSVQLLL